MKRMHILRILVLVAIVFATGQSQWLKQTGGLPATWGNGMAMDACSPSVAVIGVVGASPSVYLTKDGGVHFLPMTTPALPIDISIVDSLHVWIVSELAISATTNGGVTWQQQFSDTSITTFLDYIKMFDLNNGVAVGDAPRVGSIPSAGKPMAILETTDGGAHWIKKNISSLIDMASGDTWRRIDFVNMSVGYIRTSFGAGMTQKIYKTTNGGTSWSSVLGFNTSAVLKFYDDQIGLVNDFTPGYEVVATATTFYRTKDGGVTWDTVLASNIGSGWGNDIEFLPGDPSRVWFTNGNKLFFSSDTGRRWQEQVITPGNVGGRDIVFTDATHGWFLCNNGNLYHTVNGNSPFVEVEDQPLVIPDNFKLKQNFPNPFNPTTLIRFEVPTSGQVSLEVFNLLGQKVATLVNDVRQAGAYSVIFNASGLPTGMYFYRLQAGAYSATKKLVWMK